MAKEKNDSPDLVEVTLVKQHTHNSVPCEVGAKILVTQPERDWLREQKIITE